MSAGAGPDQLHARLAQRVERRRDDFDLLAAEMAGLAGVRIEAADQDARRSECEAAAQIAVEDAQHSLQQVAGDRRADVLAAADASSRAQRAARRSPAS